MITFDVPELWQWDINITVTADTAEELHFAYVGDYESLVVKPTEIDDSDNFTATIPNSLLQRYGMLYVWRVNDDKSTETVQKIVKPRPKPSDYVYEESTIESYQQIKDWFLGAYNDMKEQAEKAVESAGNAEQSASKAADSAAVAESTAKSAQDALKKAWEIIINAGNTVDAASAAAERADAAAKRAENIADVKRATQVTVGGGMPLLSGIEGDSYIDYESGNLWVFENTDERG